MSAYSELAVTTNFSFLRGGSHPEELVSRAGELGLAGIAVADRNSLAGVVRGHVMAKEKGLRYAVGCRLVFRDGTPDIIGWPTDRMAYGRLCRLLTLGNSRAEKGECHLDLADLFQWGAGMMLGIFPGAGDGSPDAPLAALSEAFPGNVRLLASLGYGSDDHRRLALLARTARRFAVPLMATNDVHYHVAERRPLQDVLTCIREKKTLTTAGFLLAANAERHLKSPAEMARLFRDFPEAVAETTRVMERLKFSLDELRYQYPDEATGDAASPQEALERLTEAGARDRFPNGVPPKIRESLDHELKLIGDLHFAAYFLTVHDIMRFARSQHILCQGRGSAANSVVCYCLRITEVNPAVCGLLFERFISAERGEPPDIDVDFEHERREEVMQYIYGKYGRHRTGLAATVITYRSRSAVREVGKVFGLSDDVVGALTGSMWGGWSSGTVPDKEVRRAGFDPHEATMRRVLDLSAEIAGFPRHLSQHVGGFVMTRDRLDEMVPILNAAMEDRTTVEWDKDDLNALGILKVDVLALGMLSCIRRAFDFLRVHYSGAPTLASIQDEDPAVYRMLCRADSVGVFQVESRAQMSMLPRLKPMEFYDLVIEVAIVRPGPIQGGMVHPYLRRRQGLEPTHYPSEELREVLGKTMGVPLFQEQAMKIAIIGAGFSPGEADQLRRAMATFKRVGTIGNFKERFIAGMAARNYDREFAERCFRQIEGFGDYGFPESHAASFALLVYASAWLKCHYPDVFCAALLNAQPMGFYAPAQIVRDAERHGVTILPPDVNLSDWDAKLEDIPESASSPNWAPASPTGRGLQFLASKASLELKGEARSDEVKSRLHPFHAEMAKDIRTRHAVRLGFRQIKGFREDDAQAIIAARGQGYDSVRDLWLRTGLPRATIERLADGDAFRSLGLDRRDALWAARGEGAVKAKDRLPLFDTPAHADIRSEPDFALPPMPIGEHVVNDYRYLSLSLKAHPLSFLRERLAGRGIIPAAALREISNNRRVTVAGLVITRQRPGTANGVIFMTLEDETDIANAIVWPKTFEIFRPIVLGARLIALTGKVQSASDVIHVVADRIEDLTPLLAVLSADGGDLSALARADEVARPGVDAREKVRPRARIAALNRDEPARLTSDAMPKGRNFH